jgi:translation initiation factor 4G
MVVIFRFFDHGVIQVFSAFQIFDKALDEPKYSSMYAQLCKRLSEEAPNFEPPNSPCTFRLLLLNKCRTEFENRSKASEAFEHRDGPLAPEEEERRQLTKRKMLGNIKVCMFLNKYASPTHVFSIYLILQKDAVGETLFIWLQFCIVAVDL